MAKTISILNVVVIGFVVVTTLFWAGSPAAPTPLPSDPHFVAQIRQPGTVLVKFGADWCAPCRKLEEELDILANSASDHVSVIKVDVNQNRALADHYNVSSIPHLILFQNGKQVSTANGYRSYSQLREWIAKTR